jgi:hypothetical protein
VALSTSILERQKRIAGAAMQSALDMGEYDLRMVADPAAKLALQDEITQLRQCDS